MNREEARSRLGDPNSSLKRGSRERRGTGRRLTLKAAGYGQVRMGCPWTSERGYVSCVTCAKLNTSVTTPSESLGVLDEDVGTHSGTALGIRLVPQMGYKVLWTRHQV